MQHYKVEIIYYSANLMSRTDNKETIVRSEGKINNRLIKPGTRGAIIETQLLTQPGNTMEIIRLYPQPVDYFAFSVEHKTFSKRNFNEVIQKTVVVVEDVIRDIYPENQVVWEFECGLPLPLVVTFNVQWLS